MERLLKLDSIAQANGLVGKETLHPQVTVIDFSKHGEMDYVRMNMGLYGVFLKTTKDIDVQYGRYQYDYQDGTLIFIAPGQVIGFDDKKMDKRFQPNGWGLMFHPDFILNSSLGKRIDGYKFFGYDVHEALHVSEQEKQIVLDCFSKIESELKRGIDKHSKMLIVSSIELLLNYCIRFYDRQFITRENLNIDTLSKFERLLNHYFKNENCREVGLPTVAYCAEQLNLSASYLGDLIKKETGKTAQEYIQLKIIDVAKEKLFDTSKSIAEIAYELGFKYPQHFTRLFKQKVGQTPNVYRSLN